MDRATFLLLAPSGTVLLDWDLPTDDACLFSARAPNGERCETWDPCVLLSMVAERQQWGSSVVSLNYPLAA